MVEEGGLEFCLHNEGQLYEVYLQASPFTIYEYLAILSHVARRKSSG